MISQRKAKEENEGGDSLNLHWKFRCRNRHGSGFTTAQPYLNWHCCSLRCCISASYSYFLPPLSAGTRPSVWQSGVGCSTAEIFLIIFLCQDCYIFCWLNIPGLWYSQTNRSVSTRWKAVTDWREQRKSITGTATNNFNHFKLSLVRPQYKKTWQQPKSTFLS